MVNRYKKIKQLQPTVVIGEWLRGLRRSIPTVYYTLACLCIMTVALMIATVFFRVARVQGSSMEPTLNDGDVLLLSCVGHTAEKGDIVAVRREKASPLIKRVVGTAGDRIYIDPNTGEVYLNSELLDEPYIAQETLPVDLPGEVVVPEGQLFVLGDNRAVSHDSRYMDVGFVEENDVVGKAVWRFLPLSKRHRIG